MHSTHHFIYTSSIGEMAACICCRHEIAIISALGARTNSEAVDITKNILGKHVSKLIQLTLLLAMNQSAKW